MTQTPMQNFGQGSTPRREARGVRWYLTFLVLSCLVPAATIIGALIWLNYVEGREGLKHSTLATARTLGASVDQELGEVQAGLSALATSPLIAQGDLPRFHAQAKAYVARQQIALNVVLIDRQGDQVLNTARPLGTKVSASSAELRDVIKTGKPVITNLFLGPLRKRMIVAVGVPVTVDGAVAYTLAAGIEPEKLRALLMGQSKDWMVVLADRNTTIIARSHGQERLVGQQVSKRLAASIRSRSEGYLDETTRDGVQVIALHAKAPVSGWAVAIGVPITELLDPLRRTVLTIGGVTFLLLGACLVLAWFMSGRIRRTVQALADAAQQLGNDQPIIVPPLHFREAAQVAQVLVAARESLLSMHDDLARNELRLSMILDSAMDAIVVLDGKRRIVRSNPAATTKFLHSTEAILLQPVETLVVPAGRAELAHELDLAREGVAHTLGGKAAVGRRSNGDEFPMDVSVSAVVIHGELFYTLIMRDISQRVATEAALVQSNLDLKQFAYVAAHDLRSPLRSIHGFLELLSMRMAGKLDASSTDLFDRMKRAVNQMSTLTEDLLSFARLNQEPRAFVEVDLDALVKDVLLNLGAQIAQANAEIDVDPLPLVDGDPTQLTQLLQNLIGNALKYSGQRQPVVKVRCEENTESFKLSVSDNGIGIDPQYHARIFEVFKRLHTQREIPGSGIGLAICKRVVQTHHGEIGVESEIGAGSTFHFTLPKPRKSRRPAKLEAADT